MGKKKGRPSNLDKIDLDKLLELSTKGLTDKEIAKELGIAESSLNLYKKSKEFSESLKKGKDTADDKVEASLFKRACGMTIIKEKVDKDGCIHECKEEIVPDTLACIFWLKNRRKAEWRDKQELELQGQMTFEQIRKQQVTYTINGNLQGLSPLYRRELSNRKQGTKTNRLQAELNPDTVS